MVLGGEIPFSSGSDLRRSVNSQSTKSTQWPLPPRYINIMSITEEKSISFFPHWLSNSNLSWLCVVSKGGSIDGHK